MGMMGMMGMMGVMGVIRSELEVSDVTKVQKYL